MIPRELQRALAEEVLCAPPGQPRYVMMLVDMAVLSDVLRDKIMKDMTGQIHPLLQDPDFLMLQPLGAMLAGPADNSRAALDALFTRASQYNANVVQAWITSALNPKDLATHLSQATFAASESAGERYLLRYYDPLITPILHQSADPAWVQGFFSPILSWWFAGATAAHEQWHRIPGSAQARSQPLHPLVLTDQLWRELVTDPFPHRLLHALEQDCPEIFSSECKGVRLVQIETHLATAKQYGLSRHDDLVAYVVVALSRPSASLARDPSWRGALQRAADGGAPLAAPSSPSLPAAIKDSPLPT